MRWRTPQPQNLALYSQAISWKETGWLKVCYFLNCGSWYLLVGLESFTSLKVSLFWLEWHPWKGPRFFYCGSRPFSYLWRLSSPCSVSYLFVITSFDYYFDHCNSLSQTNLIFSFRHCSRTGSGGSLLMRILKFLCSWLVPFTWTWGLTLKARYLTQSN